MKCQSKNLKTISSVERLNNHVSKSYNGQSEDSITMSVINLNIQQPTKKSNFIFYSDREYEKLYGWKKQHEADKLFAQQKSHKQEVRSISFLEQFVAKLTNGEKLVLKYLLSMMLTVKKNKKPFQVKNEIIANEIGCSVWLVKQATKKFAAAKIFAKEQSNKYAVNVYTCFIDKNTRGILYNLCNDTTPHILKIKEPTKALKKSPYTLYRESVKSKKLGYPHIHNLPTTDIIRDLFINPRLRVSEYIKCNNLNNLQSNILISKGDNCTPLTTKQETSTNFTHNVAIKVQTSPVSCYNDISLKAQETHRMNPDTYQKEILKRLNPDYVARLKQELQAEEKVKQESPQLNDIGLRMKLIEQAKKMYPESSLLSCGGDEGEFRSQIAERSRLVRNKIQELYKEHGIQ